MLPRAVLLIPGNEVGWTDVRTTLRAMTTVRVVGEATDADDVLRLVADAPPRVILAAKTVGGAPTLPLLTEIRRHAPATRLLIFASHYTTAELAAFAALVTSGCLLWSDLTVPVLRDCLAAVLEGDVHISSQSAVDAFMETVRDPARLHPAEIYLTERERAVLRHLAAGRTQKQIAGAEGMSERTVKRIVASLEEKLDVPSQFSLGVRAAQLGLVS